MSKVELRKIHGDGYYFSGRLAIGAIINPKTKQVILIDSGLDAGIAQDIFNVLCDEDVTVAAIINTHSLRS